MPLTLANLAMRMTSKTSCLAVQHYLIRCFHRNRKMNLKNVHGRKINIAKNIYYMMEMVKEYLTGATPRYIFELDFETEILSKYRKMARENKEYAELFYDLISEGGVD